MALEVWSRSSDFFRFRVLRSRRLSAGSKAIRDEIARVRDTLAKLRVGDLCSFRTRKFVFRNFERFQRFTY